MRLRTCFLTFNYLLALLGVLCLVFGEVFPLVPGVLVLTGLGVCWAMEWKKHLPIQPPALFSLWKIAAFGGPIIFFAFRPSILHLVTGFLVFALFTRFLFKTELNDYLYGYLISIVCLLIGAIFIQDIIFGLLFISFYLSLCWALMFYNMVVERVGSRSPPDTFRAVGEAESAGALLFGISASMILLSLVLTVAIFLSFPRLGLGFLEWASEDSPAVGFTEKVQLGAVGQIKQNTSVVMRVTFSKDEKAIQPAGKVLWRGIALDHYDGTNWSSTMPMVWRGRHRPGTITDLFHVPNPIQAVKQEIFMESFNSPVVFTYGVPMKIDGTFKRLQMDNGYVFRVTDSLIGPRRFVMHSDTGTATNRFKLPIHPDLSYLKGHYTKPFFQLPEMSDRMVQFASQLVKPGDSDIIKAEKIQLHLLTQYGYTLDMKRETQLPVIDEFLFVRQKGHCEYFATAMALLLRLNHIPARIVNGFMGVEWNEMGNYMIVRQSHAHTWVEAYFPEQGWVVFDPTPPDPNVQTNSMNAASRAYDMMRLYWQRYVVKYSFNDQVRIVRFFDRETRQIGNRFKNLKTLEWKDIVHFLDRHPWIWLVMGLLLGAFFILRAKFSWQGWTWAPKPPGSVRLYQAMLRRLEKQGVHKPHNWTHLEFLDHLDPLPPDTRQRVEAITRFYERTRFGNRPTSDAEMKQMETLARTL